MVGSQLPVPILLLYIVDTWGMNQQIEAVCLPASQSTTTKAIKRFIKIVHHLCSLLFLCSTGYYLSMTDEEGTFAAPITLCLSNRNNDVSWERDESGTLGQGSENILVLTDYHLPEM